MIISFILVTSILIQGWYSKGKFDEVKELKFVFRDSESNGTYLISFADIKYFFTCGYLF